jgi:hypothetical protein
MVGATRSEFRNDFSPRPGHLFHDASARRGQVEVPAAEDDYALVAIRLRRKRQNRLEVCAPYHQRINARHELVVAVAFAAAGRKSRSPFGLAMNPSTLVPINTDTIIVESSLVGASNPSALFRATYGKSQIGAATRFDAQGGFQ